MKRLFLLGAAALSLAGCANSGWYGAGDVRGPGLYETPISADRMRIVHQAQTLPHRVCNAGNGSEVTVQRLVDAVKSAVPDARIEVKSGKSPTPLQPDNYLDISRAKEDFGWSPKVPLEDGVREAIDYYREFGVSQTYTHLKVGE